MMDPREEIRQYAREHGYSKAILSVIEQGDKLMEELKLVRERVDKLSRECNSKLELIDAVFDELKASDIVKYNSLMNNQTCTIRFTNGDTLYSVMQRNSYPETVSMKIIINRERINTI
jgi:hypothetical protein